MAFVVDYLVPGFIWLFAVAAMSVGMGFILSKALSRMPNRASRFVALFVLGVPFAIFYGYSKAWLRDTRMGWTEALILALPVTLFCAVLFTFWLPLQKNSK